VEKAFSSINHKNIQAIIIRTLPNSDQKIKAVHSGKNPVYLTPDAAKFLNQQGIKHLLLDLPSVDREEDQGFSLLCLIIRNDGFT
jgi:arylformamidase